MSAFLFLLLLLLSLLLLFLVLQAAGRVSISKDRLNGSLCPRLFFLECGAKRAESRTHRYPGAKRAARIEKRCIWRVTIAHSCCTAATACDKRQLTFTPHQVAAEKKCSSLGIWRNLITVIASSSIWTHTREKTHTHTHAPAEASFRPSLSDHMLRCASRPSCETLWGRAELPSPLISWWESQGWEGSRNQICLLHRP